VDARIDVLGLQIDCVDMEGAVRRAAGFIDSGKHAHLVLAVNPEKVIAAREEPALAEVLRESDLSIPDGIGVVVAARMLGGRGIRRVASSDLMPELCGLAAQRGWPIYLYGASEEVNSRAADALRARYPGLTVAGRSNGYVEPGNMEHLIADINASGAKLLFVGLGSPRQELWMRQYRRALTTVRVCQGVGGTLDVIAGRVKRAPSGWRAVHLEWLYRLISEPARIKRQSRLPIFIWHVLKAKARRLGGRQQ
jgi:N-acetylglucosaminyldiphosphoundecaprenol N-acetyl-beta-D-mannosaminyltransferase